jgi:sec-independent protein translocase protein TatA
LVIGIAGSLRAKEDRMPGLPSLGAPELIIILVIVLIVFGAGKVPDIAKGLGQIVGEFRRASQGVDLDKELSQEEDKKES